MKVNSSTLLVLPMILAASVIPAFAAENGNGDALKKSFAPLPKSAANADNPANDKKTALGKALFFEPRLSKSGWISCSSCHNLSMGGVDRLPTSIGHKWNIVGRNAPTVLNAAIQASQFWDGRAKDVEQQAGGPILAPGEMGATEDLVLNRLKSMPYYVNAFKEAYPKEANAMTYANLAKAIAAFERTLLTPSRFDKFLEGKADALKEDEKAGLKLFVELGCAGCHNGPGVGGGSFQKFGVVKRPNGSLAKDEGRFNVTKDEKDKYVFKVPLLRNIELSAPYFHDGSVATLEEAVSIMAETQLGKKLAEKEVQSIVAFLKSLNGEPQLPVTLPILPPSSKDTPAPNVN